VALPTSEDKNKESGTAESSAIDDISFSEFLSQEIRLLGFKNIYIKKL